MAMTSCIVVDDDQDIVDVFCDMLDMIGVNVLATANDGDQAVSMYKKYRPDIVFTDLNMPKYDGFYAIEKITDVNPNAKIVVVTGDSNAYQYPFLDSPNVRVIQKPFDIQIIKQVITDCLAEDVESAQFNIKYQFKGEIRSYSCTVTYEQFKNLKVLISEANSGVARKVLTVSSPDAQDGKSLVSASLAFSFAMDPGRRVIIVDSGGRNPR